MPPKDAHLAQAHHNEAFLEVIRTVGYNDWVATVLFYVSLHYIDAFLASRPMPIHPPHHDARDRMVSMFAELKPLAANYFKLKNMSRSARYDPPPAISTTEITNLEQVHLKTIITALTPLL